MLAEVVKVSECQHLCETKAYFTRDCCLLVLHMNGGSGHPHWAPSDQANLGGSSQSVPPFLHLNHPPRGNFTVNRSLWTPGEGEVLQVPLHSSPASTAAGSWPWVRAACRASSLARSSRTWRTWPLSLLTVIGDKPPQKSKQLWLTPGRRKGQAFCTLS